MSVINSFVRGSLTIRINLKVKTTVVIVVLSDRSILRCILKYFRFATGAEFNAQSLSDCLAAFRLKTAYIIPGKPQGDIE